MGTERNSPLHRTPEATAPSPHYGVGVPIRVAMVNDYEVVVLGLARMLRAYGQEFEVMELNAQTRVVHPVDIALYDTFGRTEDREPGLNTLLLNPRVRRVVVYSWNDHPIVLRATMARRDTPRGIAGYVSKTLPAAALASALRDVHRGRKVLATGQGTSVPGDWPGREEGLTVRESEVLALITRGLSNNDIAERTGLSINSIKSYIRTGYRKIGVTSRSTAVLWGVAHGLLPDRSRIEGEDATA
jgi:DNA-binding NarL/FixJ family response regulator